MQKRGISAFVKADKYDGIGKLGYKKIKLAKGKKASDALLELKSEKIVQTAELNGYYDILLTPNDTLYSQQWSHTKMQSPLGWDLSTGGSNITVAIVDTGVDYNHEDLTGKVIKGHDFYNNDDDPMDDHYHGTHCAGIAAAYGNNSKGVAGVSWGAKILAVKVLLSSGSGSWE
jgi:thermitase